MAIETGHRHLDVIVIGAGLSGVDMGYRLQTDYPGRRYLILEARDAIGGTWDLFRYPGVRSDSDMYTLGFPFRPWSSARPIAGGEAIRDYIADTAAEYGIDRHIRFGHRVVSADWSSVEARWTLAVDTPDGRGTFTCRFLYMGSGYYDYAAGYTPVFEGVDNFAGRLVHPQHWPADLDHAGARVVVIGSGATAVTLVPAMADRAAHVTMLQRSPTYIVSRPGEDGFAAWAHRRLPRAAANRAARWKSILLGMATFTYARRRPDRMKALILKGVRDQLPENYEIERDFEPSYKPWDQRICLVPDADLFAAIRSGKASIVTDHIDRFTDTGILLRSGLQLDADVVVTATGLSLKLFGGVAVHVDGRAITPSDHLVYKGMMLSDVPNLAFAFGYTNASWTLKCDLSARYACRLINHMDRQGYASAAPRPAADVTPEPLLSFTSGYVQRADAMLPHQGSRAPWRVHQNYALDLAALKLSSVEDGVMQFERPGTQPVSDAAEASSARPVSTPVIAAGIAAATIGGMALFSQIMARRIEQQVPPDGKFIEVNGTRLHYLDRGAGPAVVMIHGLGGQMRNFSYALTERLGGHRLILVDRPGSGYSDRIAADRSSAADQAELIAKFIAALGLDRPLVVGHSLGGAVALALALNHPGCVGRLALIAPLTHPEHAPPEAFQRMAVAFAPARRAFAWTMATPLSMLAGNASVSAVFAPEPVPADFPTRGGGALVARPGNFFAASSDMVAANNGLDEMVRRYPTLTLPIAIIFGREDNILDPTKHGEALAAAAPNATLTLVEGAGHMIPVTRPDDVATWLLAQSAR